jgi:ATPase family associated with various cellular activities (AAA)
MGEKYLDSIVLWTEHSQRSLLAFWRPSKRDFWRDTAEMEDPKPEKYYPTATFMSVAALRNEIFPTTIGNGQFNWLAFLGGIKTGFEGFLESSEVSSTGEEKRWNVYTSSWSVRALDAARTALSRDPENGKLSNQKWFEWIDGAIDKQAQLIAQNLKTGKGATLPGDDDGTYPHPFLTTHALAAIRKADRLKRNGYSYVPNALRRIISINTKTQLERIVTSHAAGTLQPADLIALPYCAAVLQACGSSANAGLINCAIDLVCASHVQMGGWPLVGSQLGSTGHGVQVSSFDIGATLVNLCARLDDDGRSESQQIRQKAFGVLFDAVRRTIGSVNSGGREISGWGSAHSSPTQRIESWTTALAVRFLKKLRAYSQRHTQRGILGEYGAISGSRLEGLISWSEIADPEPEVGIKRYIETHFFDTLSTRGATAFPSQTEKNVSMILFGPPGTSKTTIAKAIAKHLEWPILTITPALFLARGVDGIDASATKVFADLQELERVVVFFDECDELFRQRAAGDEATNQLSLAALITGAMLPRLQDLHDRGKLIFILATNRLLAIDTAVRREGRIDHVIAIGPPDENARSILLKAYAPRVPKGRREIVASVMERFTRDEVIRTAQYIARYYADSPRATPVQLRAEVTRFLGDQDLTISPVEWSSFLELRKNFSRPHKLN